MSKNNINNYLQGIDIAEGFAVRGDCPACNAKNTFTVTKENGVLLYNCYKLSCKVSGYKNIGLTAQEIKQRLTTLNESKRKEVVPLVWPEYVVMPSAEHTMLHNFIQTWGLGTEDLLYDVKDRRAVFQIYSKGMLVDATGRALDGANPKWLRYSGVGSTYTRVFGKPSGVIVVVEDVISAIIAAQENPGLTGMAILGTSLTPDHMEMLDGYHKVIVALDPDAVHKTVQYKREIQSWTGLETVALRLEDDLKYKKTNDLAKLKEVL